MCNARRFGFVIFLALAGALIPCADVDAGRRCRRAVPQCMPECISAVGLEEMRPFFSFPVITGTLFDAALGKPFVLQATINVYKTVDGVNPDGTAIGFSSGAFTNGVYTVNCTAGPNTNNVILIVYQRGGGPTALGTPTTIAVTTTMMPIKINAALP